MVTKEKKEDTKESVQDEYCPIQRAIDNNKKRISEMTKIKEVKKKAVTQQEKKYSYLLKMASCIVLILAFGSMLATIFVPDIGDAIMAFFESLDPLKRFRGGRALDPSDYVMFLK